MSKAAPTRKSCYGLLYEVLLIFLLLWEVFAGWVQTAVHFTLTRQTPFLLDRFSLLSLFALTAVPYAAYHPCYCLLE